MTEMIQKEEKNDKRWLPKDHKFIYPFEEQKQQANKKNIILVIVYLILLLGSLFVI